MRLEATTIHVSDRKFTYRYGSSSITYDPYLLEIQGIGEETRFQQATNPRVQVRLADKRWGTYSRLSLLDRDVPFRRAIVAIYELRLSDLGCVPVERVRRFFA